jgi:hypothetical protein
MGGKFWSDKWVEWDTKVRGLKSLLNSADEVIDMLETERIKLLQENDEFRNTINDWIKIKAELRKEIFRLQNGSNFPLEVPDYQVAYIPMYKEFPFPLNFSDAQVIAAEHSHAITCKAIVKVLWYPGQMDK